MQAGFRLVEGPKLKIEKYGGKTQKMWKYIFEDNVTKEKDAVYVDKKLRRRTLRRLETTTLPLYLLDFVEWLR